MKNDYKYDLSLQFKIIIIKAIRYYLHLSLITEPAKPTTGYHHYPVDNIADRIKFTKRAQKIVPQVTNTDQPLIDIITSTGYGTFKHYGNVDTRT